MPDSLYRQIKELVKKIGEEGDSSKLYEYVVEFNKLMKRDVEVQTRGPKPKSNGEAI